MYILQEIELLKCVQERAMKLVKWLEIKMWRSCWSLQLPERWLQWGKHQSLNWGPVQCFYKWSGYRNRMPTRHMELGGAVDFLGAETSYRSFDKLESWAIINCMKFNNSKCRILHVRWSKDWGTTGWKADPEKGIWRFMLNLTQQRVLAAKRANWCIRPGTASQERKGMAPLCVGVARDT